MFHVKQTRKSVGIISGAFFVFPVAMFHVKHNYFSLFIDIDRDCGIITLSRYLRSVLWHI